MQVLSQLDRCHNLPKKLHLAMAKHVSETPATQWLKQKKVSYTEHPYDYVDHGGTAESSQQLGLPEHEVVKTLVMQDENGKGLVVLMHGDCKTSTKNLARQIGRKHVESSILALPKIWINGGRRGFLVGIDPQVLVKELGAQPVECALPQ
jgi:prolyl-tRNA editing enzyme YbaK/EbsC (Cys-tRNA(Pro) deacylase)